MPTTYLRAQTIVPSSGGLPGNQLVVTTHWKNQAPGATREVDAVTICARMKDLLNALVPQSLDGSLGFASYMATLQAYTDVYDLVEAKPRVPFHTEPTPTTFAPPTSSWDLPPEVSLCVSYQGPRVSGLAQNRRRGRLYVGPLAVYQAASLDLGAPTTAACDLMCTRTRTTLQPKISPQPYFCVLSRQTWAGLGKGEKPPPDPNTGEIIFPEIPGNLEAALVTVGEFWCDNAWDTQRRRGLRATTRSSQPT